MRFLLPLEVSLIDVPGMPFHDGGRTGPSSTPSAGTWCRLPGVVLVEVEGAISDPVFVEALEAFGRPGVREEEDP